jgi:hypothetical protein
LRAGPDLLADASFGGGSDDDVQALLGGAASPSPSPEPGGRPPPAYPPTSSAPPRPQVVSARIAARYAVAPPAAVGRGAALPPAAGKKPPPAKPAPPPASTSSAEAPSGSANRAAASSRAPAVRTNSSLRCGKCEPCLNRHWKKVCVEVRKRQEEGDALPKDKDNARPLAQAPPPPPPQAQQKPPPPRPPPAAAAASSAAVDDPFVRTLRGVVSASGGVVQSRHVRLLSDLLRRASTTGHRAALLTVLQKSSAEVQAGAVQAGALLQLQAWLSAAVGVQPPKPKPVLRVLGCLRALPVTIAALQHPCELGKLVGRLRKAPGLEEAHAPAKQLVAKWKALVEKGGPRSVGRPPACMPRLPACPPARPPACPAARAL